MATISNEEVAAYLPAITRLARRYNKRDYRIETDDLIQEAWEAVWKVLESGGMPNSTTMLFAMNKWADHVTRGVPYDAVGLNVQEAVSG